MNFHLYPHDTQQCAMKIESRKSLKKKKKRRNPLSPSSFVLLFHFILYGDEDVAYYRLQCVACDVLLYSSYIQYYTATAAEHDEDTHSRRPRVVNRVLYLFGNDLNFYYYYIFFVLSLSRHTWAGSV